MSDSREHEQSNDILIEKVTAILDKVKSIDTKLDKHDEKINELGVKQAVMQHDIEELKGVNSKMWGVIAGVVVAVVGAIIKTFLGVWYIYESR